MTEDEIKQDLLRVCKVAGWDSDINIVGFHALCDKLKAIGAAEEREALEAELLKLKHGVAASSDYVQGRWDLIGEFQDVIRARGNT